MKERFVRTGFAFDDLSEYCYSTCPVNTIAAFCRSANVMKKPNRHHVQGLARSFANWLDRKQDKILQGALSWEEFLTLADQTKLARYKAG